MREREREKLFWILSVDMAHMGLEYQDRFAARTMVRGIGECTRPWRIARINTGPRGSTWDLVRENRDDLKWCGSSPFYLSPTAPGPRGELLRCWRWTSIKTAW